MYAIAAQGERQERDRKGGEEGMMDMELELPGCEDVMALQQLDAVCKRPLYTACCGIRHATAARFCQQCGEVLMDRCVSAVGGDGVEGEGN